MLKPSLVSRSVGARGCGGRSLRAARASPQPAGARAPGSPSSLSPFSSTEPRHRLPPSSATSASRARACHFLSAPAAAAPASFPSEPPPLRLDQATSSERSRESGEGSGKRPRSAGAPQRPEDLGGQPESRAGAPRALKNPPRGARSRALRGAARGRARGSLQVLRRQGVGPEAAPTSLLPRSVAAGLM